MNKAKSCKILSLFAVMVFTLVMALCTFTSVTAFAAAPQASRYFEYKTANGNSASSIKFESDVAVLPMRETEEIAFVREIVIDDLQMVLSVPVDSVKEFDVKFPISSYIVTGNKNVDEEFDTTIENAVNFKVGATGFDIALNEKTVTVPFNTSDKTFVEIGIKTENNRVIAKVNGVDVPVSTDDYYKIKINDKPVSTISIEMIELAENVVSANMLLKSVNTKASATDSDDYQQTFKLDATGSGFANYARPRYVISEGLINQDGNVIVGEEYTASVTAYSLMGTSTTPYLKSGSDSVKVFGTAKKNIKFEKEGTESFVIYILDSNTAEVVCETYSVNAVKEGRNGLGQAPVYNGTDSAIESFKDALNKALYKDIENNVFIGLGSDQYVNLPSFESLVSDNVSSYKNLTYTVYYKGPDTSSTYSSSLKIPVAKAGKYSFYVAFKDKNGNAMSEDSFIKDENVLPDPSIPDYSKYVFEFEIFDNAELSASARPQGTAFVGIEYKATNFKVVASENTKTYKLSYSATATPNLTDGIDYDWKEIPLASIDEEKAESYAFTYETIKNINFTGALTFTPHAEGYYKLECIINSSSSTRWVEAETIIESKAPITVGEAKDATKANIPQIIFLCVGGVCFLGIIALFFVKPKNKKED